MPETFAIATMYNDWTSRLLQGVTYQRRLLRARLCGIETPHPTWKENNCNIAATPVDLLTPPALQQCICLLSERDWIRDGTPQVYLTARRDTVSVGGSGRLFLRPCLESPGIATMVLMKRIGVEGCKCRTRGA